MFFVNTRFSKNTAKYRLFIRVGRGEKDCAHTFDENIEVDASWPLLLASAVNTVGATSVEEAWTQRF